MIARVVSHHARARTRALDLAVAALTEARIAKVARHCARACILLESAGEFAGAARLRECAMDVVETMRRKGRE